MYLGKPNIPFMDPEEMHMKLPRKRDFSDYKRFLQIPAIKKQLHTFFL